MSDHEDFELIENQYDELMHESLMNRQERDNMINPKHQDSLKLKKKSSQPTPTKVDSESEDFEDLDKPMLKAVKSALSAAHQRQKKQGRQDSKGQHFNQKLNDFIQNEKNLLEEMTNMNEKEKVPEQKSVKRK